LFEREESNYMILTSVERLSSDSPMFSLESIESFWISEQLICSKILSLESSFFFL